MDSTIVRLSAIDTERFGIPIARAQDLTVTDLPGVVDFCRTHSVRMLVARCRTADVNAAQAMEAAGFQIMDTLVYYVYKFARSPIPPDQNPVAMRFVRPGDEQQVERIARLAFQGYRGHYHADARLDRQKADQAYISWAVRSCTSRDVADDVLIAHNDEDILGFATLRMNTPQEGEGVLFGVAPAAQGQGIYRSFMIRAMHWTQQQQAEQMVVSTQVDHIAVQKVWARLGFVMSHSYYTFHKWFDE